MIIFALGEERENPNSRTERDLTLRRNMDFDEARPLFDNVIDLDEDLLDDEEMDDMFRVDIGFSERDLSPPDSLVYNNNYIILRP